ncbi:MAG: carboxypeptidase-like regulatory domain-containing protein [Thermoplasmatota archaeon]
MFQGGKNLNRRTIETRCPECRTPVSLRLPRGAQKGSFEVKCNECSAIIDLEIRPSARGKERIRVNGKPIRSSRMKLDLETEKADVIGPKVEVLEGPDHERRLRIVMVMFIIISILGMASSIATVAGSFSIKDLEERSPNDVSTFSVWVLDSGTGRPIRGVSVTLEGGDHYLNKTTDLEGLVVFQNVRTGPLEITLEADGYKTTSGEVVIMKGSPNVIDIPMEKGSSEETVPILTTQFRSKDYSTSYTNLMAAVMFLSSVLALAGAYLVHKKEFFTVAVFIAFLSIFSFGFLIGSLMSLVVIIMLVSSYDGFSHNYHLRMLLESQGRKDLKRLFTEDEASPPRLPPAKGG